MVQAPFHFAMLSHPGRVRNGNEDACAADAQMGAFVVCDGMGGAAAGEVASRMAVETWLQALHLSGAAVAERASLDVRLEQAVKAANQMVFDYSRSAPGLRSMGSTLVGLLLEDHPDNGVGVGLAHVGDSRCYRWRNGALTQLTRDHSLMEEQIALGRITALEAETHPMRNIMTRAIGLQRTVQPDILRLEPRPGDLYLLASDGLTRELSDVSITRLLRAGAAGEFPGEQAALHSLCNVLVDAANSAGGGDNITVLLVALS